MSINLNTDLTALSFQRNLKNLNISSTSFMERLSTGVRINSASDDAANLSLSKKIESKTSGIKIANNNINIALGKLQTFDGYLEQITNSLQKMRDLAVQSANGTYSDSNRSMLDSAATEILNEIQQTSSSANSIIGGNITGAAQMTETEATAAGYTTIHNAAEFVSLINGNLAGQYMLMNDIDMSSLGTLTNSAITSDFTGILDGNGYTINNLTINTGGAAVDAIGLFSRVNGGGELNNVAMESTSITATNSRYTGLLVGILSSADISNSHTTGIISGKDYSGGLAGYASSGNIQDSYSNSNVTGSSIRIGGLVGSTNGTNVTRSYATGNVSGNHRTGGLIGDAMGGTIISYSYATGNVNGADATAGLAGVIQAGTTVSYSYATGSVTGASYTGGLTGLNSSATEDNTNFWNTETTGIGTSSGSAIGLTTTEISSGTSPIDTWDTNIWNLSGSTPQLIAPNSTPSGSSIASVQTGTNNDASSYYDLTELSINVGLSINLSTTAASRSSMQLIDNAIESITNKRAELGANINHLENLTDSNNNKHYNLTDVNKTIRDADIAVETTNFVKNQIQTQSVLAMLQQAQQINAQSILNFY